MWGWVGGIVRVGGSIPTQLCLPIDSRSRRIQESRNPKGNNTTIIKAGVGGEQGWDNYRRGGVELRTAHCVVEAGRPRVTSTGPYKIGWSVTGRNSPSCLGWRLECHGPRTAGHEL